MAKHPGRSPFTGSLNGEGRVHGTRRCSATRCRSNGTRGNIQLNKDPAWSDEEARRRKVDDDYFNRRLLEEDGLE